jgi:chorismate dehydratase
LNPDDDDSVLRLGHIEYSNCFPVHALLLDRGVPPGIELRPGVPAVLNAELRAGRLDVAPSSSIEFARNADRYRILPGLVIGAAGAVHSILLESETPPEALDGEEVALPTASATSVVLLRILLELRLGVRPRYRWFDQAREADPIAGGAAAALWIGDRAMRRRQESTRLFTDLGESWNAWTGLPFVFALWQTSAGPERDAELRALHGLLLESLAYFETAIDALAERHAVGFGMSPERLARYWRSLSYRLDARMEEGLLHFYRLAAELREVPSVPELRWVTPAAG